MNAVGQEQYSVSEALHGKKIILSVLGKLIGRLAANPCEFKTRREVNGVKNRRVFNINQCHTPS